MTAPTFLSLPSEIRLMIYEFLANRKTIRNITPVFYLTACGELTNGHLRFPTQLLRVCRFLNEEATPILYAKLRVSSCDLERALKFVRLVGSRKVSLMESLEILHCYDSRPTDVLHWLKNNSDILFKLKYIMIYGLVPKPRDFTMISRFMFLQRLIHILCDNPEWASHRMRCDGFEDIARRLSGGRCQIELFKA